MKNTPAPPGLHPLGLGFLLGALALASPSPAVATDTNWFDDAIPAGAWTGADGGDSWNWIGGNPAPHSGTLAHQSTLAPGIHFHNFADASATLAVGSGDALFAWVYLDPANPPREIMLGWSDGTSWSHLAYWGENLIPWGTDGTADQWPMGALPPPGVWTRLEVPASAVNLEGRTLSGMGFVQYDGRATWDLAGKSAPDSGGGPPPPPAIDEAMLQVPQPGDNSLRILSPTLLELVRINAKQPDPAHVDSWDWVDDQGNFAPPDMSSLHVTVNGQPVAAHGIGFRRRPIYAPLDWRDLRIGNSLFVQLDTPIADAQSVDVTNDGTLWPASMGFAATADPLRFNPAIHVNQEGYLPAFPKKALVGYYLGNAGEMPVAATNFSLVDTSSGAAVFQGSLIQRRDVGFTYTPTPYQSVYEADFSGFTTPGEYRVVVPGMGASLRFRIDEGTAMAFARTYALGLLEQRSGFDVAMPFTRFTHAADHTAPAGVPVNDAAPYDFTWQTVANYATEVNSDNPPQIAPRLTSPSAQLFPFVNQGPIDVTGGHFEAANYSKVTWNMAQVVHVLMFAADSLPGVAALDNLGLPESGDGISDVLQEAKWEADALAKLQDADGAFYYAVNPVNREYEGDVLPENGDPQVVWPKNTVATAAAVAALAQCASSPRFQQAYPQAAADYWARAQHGWQFLTEAIARYGLDGAYQKIQHFGDDFTDRDDLAWAACEMFLATGDPQYQAALKDWFPDPTDRGNTWHWGWWPMYMCYGNAARDYAFAVKSGRLTAGQLDQDYFNRCVTAVIDGGNVSLAWSQASAYGTSFPDATKRVRTAGWYFSTEQAFDLVAAQQFNPSPDYVAAVLDNLNYEAGCNPVNVSYVTGLGWKRQRFVVDQYSANDRRILPKDGIPIGNIQEGFTWTWAYGGELTPLCFPSDGAADAPYPFYDRWADFWNVTTEASTTDYVRCFAVTAWLAAQTPPAGQAWRTTAASITAPTGSVIRGQPVTVTLQVADPDLTGAKIVWEASDQEPAFGNLSYTFTPVYDGANWIEAEVQWPDGRRAFANASVSVTSPP